MEHAANLAPRDPSRYVLHFGPLSVPSRTGAAALSEIHDALVARRLLCVAFANTHLVYCAVRDPALAQKLRAFFLLNDGVGLSLLARLTVGRAFPENLTATDLVPRVLASAPPGARLYLIGARPSVVSEAASRLAVAYPHLVLCGVRDGYSAQGPAKQEIIADIQSERAQIVLVAMGNPLQEMWIEEAARHGPSAVYFGVGAFFDFVAGVHARAPKIMRRLHLEWIYRLSREPRRLARRYTVEIAVLMAHALIWRLNRRRTAA